MKFIIYILVAYCAMNELDEFLNKDIKIYFSGYPSIILGLVDSPNLVAKNKYVDFTKHKFNPKCRIIKTGDKYELYFSGKKMCKNKKIVSVCEHDGKWQIVRKVFGYNIMSDNKCMTKGPEDQIIMTPCTESDDQLVDVKKVRSDCDPTDDFTERHSVHVNIYPEEGRRYNTENIEKETGQYNPSEVANEYSDIMDE